MGQRSHAWRVNGPVVKYRRASISNQSVINQSIKIEARTITIMVEPSSNRTSNSDRVLAGRRHDATGSLVSKDTIEEGRHSDRASDIAAETTGTAACCNDGSFTATASSHYTPMDSINQIR